MIKKALTGLALVAFIFSNATAKDYYLAPNAKAGNNGTLEQPFASLTEAQAAIRSDINNGLKEDINVYLKGGSYHLTETFVLGLKDTHQDGYKVSFKAYKDEEPVITSGVAIKNWTKLNQLPAHASTKANGQLWVADLPENLGSFKALFDGDKRLTRAKSAPWIPAEPSKSIEQSDSRNVHNNKDRYALRMVPDVNGIMREWENISDVECIFNPVPWNLMSIQLESVDTENKVGWLAFEANAQVGTKNPHHAPAFVYLENAIDFLDEPGEWCVNTVEKKIYYWPENGQPSTTIEAPALMELIRVEGKIRYDLASDIPAKNFHFEGLTFTKADRTVWYKNHKGWGIQHDWDTFDYGNALLRFRGAEDCSVNECHFTNSGGSAVRLDLHAQNITVSNNYIDYVGHMGILLAGYGPGMKYVNKNNTIHNNIIHHCGELVWHGHGIFLWQSGDNKITNNWIHDVPRKAIGVAGVRCQILMKPWSDFDEASRTIRWNEIEATADSTLDAQQRYFPYLHARNNLIKDNKATRTMLKLSDGSSINISGAGAGNIVDHNLLYNILYTGFRTDDWQDETITRNNIVWNCGGNAYIFKGFNQLYNNIAVNVKKAVHMRAYPQQSFIPGAVIRNNIFMSNVEGFEVYKPASWPKNMNLQKPGKKKMPYEYVVENNVYYAEGAKEFLEAQIAEGIEQGTVVANPLFYNVEKGDFRLKKRSPALKNGFKPFDVSFDSFGVDESYPEKFKALDNEVLKTESSAYHPIH